MTTTTQQEKPAREQDKVIRAFVLGYRQLPDKKRKRADRLIELLEQADCLDEQIEIAKAIGEIVMPAMVGRSDAPGSVVDLEEGVSDDTKRRVEAHRKHVGEAIRKRRHALRMTQQELAERSGLPQSHISRLEDGKHAPTEITIERIAKALEVEPSHLDLLYD